MNTVERIIYAVLRLFRFGLILNAIDTLFYYHPIWWVPPFLIIMFMPLAIWHHQRGEPADYFKGRLFTDIGLAGVIWLPTSYASYIVWTWTWETLVTYEHVPSWLTVAVINWIVLLIAVAICLWFYRLEHQSITTAKRMNFMPILLSRAFYGWLFWGGITYWVLTRWVI